MAPARLLVGVGSAFGTTAGGAYTMDVVGRYPHHIGLLLGTAHAVGMLGFAAGPMLGGLLADRGGAALPFTIIGCVLLASAPVFRMLPETLAPRTAAANATGQSDDLRTALSRSLASFRALLSDDTQRALLFARFALLSGWSVSLTTVPLHATAAWGATPAQLGQLYSLITLCGLATAPVAGRLTDRLGRRPLVIGGSLATATSIAALPLLGHSQAAYFGCMAVWAVGETFLITASTALAADVTPPESRGAQNALGNQVGDATFTVMPVMLGLISQHSHAAAFGCTSVLVLGANAAFWHLSSPRGPAAAAAHK